MSRVRAGRRANPTGAPSFVPQAVFPGRRRIGSGHTRGKSFRNQECSAHAGKSSKDQVCAVFPLPSRALDSCGGEPGSSALMVSQVGNLTSYRPLGTLDMEGDAREGSAPRSWRASPGRWKPGAALGVSGARKPGEERGLRPSVKPHRRVAPARGKQGGTAGGASRP